jgi:hypothetical protein
MQAWLTVVEVNLRSFAASTAAAWSSRVAREELGYGAYGKPERWG